MSDFKDNDIDVSVIIPILNEEKFIRGVIFSLINQSYPREKMEWLFVDGVSGDNTVNIIKEYENQYPIKLFNNPAKNTPNAMNIGIMKSIGKYIIRLDAHSEFPTDYIEKCVFYLKNTDAVNVGGCAQTVAEGFVGNAIAYMLTTKFGVGNSEFRTGGSGYVDTVPFGAFKREIFEKVGMFNTTLLRSEDNEMNSRIREHGGKIYLAEDISFKYYCRNTVVGILKMGYANGKALFQTLRVDTKAMRMRHFIPFLFVLSLVLLPLCSLAMPFAKTVLVIELTVYLLLDIYFSCKNKYWIINIWLYPLFHIFYGLGSLFGLLRI